MATVESPERSGVLDAILPAGGWIIGPRADLMFFLGTPLILAFMLAEQFWSLTAVSVFATVLAMGHYMPGLMRAYGDPALFRRFRLRFLLAPLFLITVSVAMANRENQAFLMVVVIWGAWHWLMQSYGLARIYDAKVKNFDTTSARLDYLMCIGWFGILYWHTDGASGVIMRYYRAGGRLPANVVHGAAYVWVAATAIITCFYVVHVIRRWRQGHRPSVLKLALLGVTFLFYLYAFGYTSSKLVAFALFEGYHDIQYLAIVWVFNRNRAAKDPQAGTLTRFLFRERWPLVLLYVLLCLGFGSYDYFAREINDAQLAKTALGVITGFALVHFYFDGFIWRIREPATRGTLDVEASGEQRPSWLQITPAVRHGLLWCGLATPVLLLAGWEVTGQAPSDADACRQVIAARPSSHKAHYLLASELYDQENFAEALQHIQQSRRIRPEFDLYDMLYADIMLRNEDLGAEQLDEIIACYQRASVTRNDVAKLHLNWGKALERRGDLRAAEARFQQSLAIDPNQSDVHFQLATIHARRQQFAQAAKALLTTVRLNSEHDRAHALLATIRMAQGQDRLAMGHFQNAIALNPDNLRLRANYARALATSRHAQVRNTQSALTIANELSQRQSTLEPGVIHELVAIYAATDHADQAVSIARRAADRFDHAGQAQAAKRLRRMVRQLNRSTKPAT